MTRSKMMFSKDAYGKEILLKEGKFQVMMEWEKPYMEACIDALKPKGDVLEVGFGCGYSARHIQTYHPKTHTIIECDPVVIEKALAFAKEFPGVTIVQDTWQNAFKQLGVFDAIFFDDYPLESEQELSILAEQEKTSLAVLDQGKAVLSKVKEVFPDLEKITYSDSDLMAFIETAGSDKEKLARFMRELKERLQITEEQYVKVCQKIGVVPEVTPKNPLRREAKEKFFLFLEEALQHHMRKGSRISCFLSSALSKYEDPKFFKEIILNPDLDYTEEKIAVEVPPNCDYYTDKEALVMVITLQK